jgi:uncharacterized protein YcbX
VIKISEIAIYPVKGLRGISSAQAVVEPRGLQYDRRWLVVDEEGVFLTQREMPKMATIATSIEEGRLTLCSPCSSIFIPLEAEGDPLCVQIWRDTVMAVEVPGANEWFSDALGMRCRFVKMPESCLRSTNPSFSQPGDIVSFADGYPCLAASVSSLADLNTRLDQQVPMSRFRPNLMFDGAEAWQEDEWKAVSTAGASFRVAKACGRCQVVTIDQDLGVPTGSEPLRTLAKFRQVDNSVNFGINLIPDGEGMIRVGDELLLS